MAVQIFVVFFSLLLSTVGSFKIIKQFAVHRDLSKTKASSFGYVSTSLFPKRLLMARKQTNRIFLNFIKFIDPVASGGLLSGGLHAITGPDHLAAILPTSVGKSGWFGLQIGALWGLGHGLSAVLLGLVAYFLKGKISGKFQIFEKLSNLAEKAVGLSLIFIGTIGIKENSQTPDKEQVESNTKILSNWSIFTNGMLHGFSWDGAPSLAPAIAMSSWKAAIKFLFAYSIGTMLAMSITAGVLGDLSTRISRYSNNPQFPKSLSIGSSLFAILIGVYWILQSTFLN